MELNPAENAPESCQASHSMLLHNFRPMSHSSLVVTISTLTNLDLILLLEQPEQPTILIILILKDPHLPGSVKSVNAVNLRFSCPPRRSGLGSGKNYLGNPRHPGVSPVIPRSEASELVNGGSV